MSLTNLGLNVVPSSFISEATTRLIFSHNELASISCMGLSNDRWSNLTYIDFSYNDLKTIPPSFTRFTKLQTLLLNNNQLTTLPLNLGDCHSLTKLDISYNKIDFLPTSMHMLRQLKSLVLKRNPLSIYF